MNGDVSLTLVDPTEWMAREGGERSCRGYGDATDLATVDEGGKGEKTRRDARDARDGGKGDGGDLIDFPLN